MLDRKDLRDLNFILTQPIEWIGLSFVRSAQDILELKNHITKANHNARGLSQKSKNLKHWKTLKTLSM